MEDYLSSTNYMFRKPVSSETLDYFDGDDHHTCYSQESGWDFLVDLIANNCESSFSFGNCESSSSLVSDSSDDMFVDEELEDTATSPILQSPKESGHASGKVEEVGISFIETELWRKGLCLVPTSFLLNLS